MSGANVMSMFNDGFEEEPASGIELPAKEYKLPVIGRTKIT